MICQTYTYVAYLSYIANIDIKTGTINGSSLYINKAPIVLSSVQ